MNRVTVVEFGGTIAEKILVEDRGHVVMVTTEEEWADSQRESRPPVTVGFKKEYLYHKE